jgi:hypothetical protein
MSLFKNSFMRKPDKRGLLRKEMEGSTHAILPAHAVYVVDGGYLLHKVRWQAPCNMYDILAMFGMFMRRFGSNTCVVFDGYDDVASTKDHEHRRRALKAGPVAPMQQVDNDTKNVGKQEAFLSNSKNKQNLIALLMKYICDCGVRVFQGEGDADTLIVSVALDEATVGSGPVAVFAEDTDILVLLLHHHKPDMNNIFVVSDSKKGKDGKKVDGKCIDIAEVKLQLGMAVCECLPAIHAFGGCDTTSAIFGPGKRTIFKKVAGEPHLLSQCKVLQNETASIADVCAAGLQLCWLYIEATLVII